jgi:porphobilinogen synthase
VWPIFVQEGTARRTTVDAMPGIERMSIDVALEAVGVACELGIPAVAVFPCVDAKLKTPTGAEALHPDNLVCRAVRRIKASFADRIGVICDVALDPYTTHGHDGLLRDGHVVNDETVALLCQQALVQAQAGCDVIAPSDMMDGRVGAVRRALDEAGFDQCQVLSYAAKYASAFYGPFRDAIGSATCLGTADKRGYQMDPGNATEALREVALDIREGADIVMIKPGMPYLDVVRKVKDTFGMPTFVYQVSGEYSMLCAAASQGWLNRTDAVLESLLAIKRAGADAILTYFALEAARLLV